jgi:hypothetical protein
LWNLCFKADGSHQFQSIALPSYSRAKIVVERNAAILNVILEMNVCGMWRESIYNVRESEIVRGQQPYGAPSH